MSESPVLGTSEIALTRAEWQPVLFAERPRRLDLLRLKPTWPLSPLVIRLHRNHSFEHVATAAAPWFAIWGRQPEFRYGDYDDSLSLGFPDQELAGLEMVWLDYARYATRFSTAEFSEWVNGRLTVLRARSGAPILVALVDMEEAGEIQLADLSRGLPAVRVAKLSPLANVLGSRFLDERAAKFSGTRLSDPACVLAARELACHWAPALLQPRLKAVVLDLDQTLFEGVLGEDAERVRLTEAHHALQQFLVGLRDQGIFLGLVSKNEEADVRRLFSTRKDFPLRWEHFSAAAISWQAKAGGIRQVANKLRIGLDAILFVDDNPGELAAVAAELPTVSTLHAATDATLTHRALEFYPGLWAWERTPTDAIRAADLEAETERARLASDVADPMDYLRSLQVKLRIGITPRAHLARLHELSQKTNQFNLNLERLSEVELAKLLDAPDHRVAVIGLQDRLSDSALIGLLIGRLEGDVLCIRELAISCRALGRRLEDLMIAEAVRAVRAELPATRVQFCHRIGPRNAPARDWLARWVGQGLASEGRVEAHHSLSRVSPADYPVAVEVIHHESKRD